MATYIVNTTNDAGVGSLRQAILDANGDPGSQIEFTIGPGSTIALASDLPQITEDVVINSTRVGGITVDGAGLYRVFWADSGIIEINDLTITGGLAQGGHGSPGYGGGAGGAGLGGGLFVDDLAAVTLRGVTFDSNSAIGGDSGPDIGGAGAGGGGGMNGAHAVDSGTADGDAGGGPAGGAGGPAGSGTAGGAGGEFSGGGGGGSSAGVAGPGGNGGFGGGGGGGGLGDGALADGGHGGFGGGGGSGYNPGTPGYGGGSGHAGGGAGAGLGGAVFVRSGGQILLEDVTFGAANAAHGGVPTAFLGAGAGEGAGLFLMDGGTLAYEVTAGETATLASSVETNAAPLTLEKTGAGTLILNADHDFTSFQVQDGVLQGDAARLDGNYLNSSSGMVHIVQPADATFAGDVLGGTVMKSGAGVLTVSGGILAIVDVTEGTLNVTGTMGAGMFASVVHVRSGATLQGTGTAGLLTVEAGGALAPGASPGTLDTGDLTLLTGATLEVELGGTGAGQFDRLNVTGTVSLGGAFLDIQLFGGFTPAAGNSFLLIDNDGADAVTGAFAGFADGVAVTMGGLRYTVDYHGGDGNDVTLTVSAIPGPPPPPRPIPSTGGSGNDLAILDDNGTSYSAGDGDDMAQADGGADFVHGNLGADTLHGGWGDDTVHGGQGGDVLYGDDGTDVLLGDKGDDLVHGGRGDDVIDGGEGSDALAGGQGDDAIRGGDGADVLTGDRGNDTLSGGAGPDVFRFTTGGGADVVTDFDATEDRVQVLGAYTLSQVGADTVVDLADGDTLTLLNVQLAALPSGWVFG